MNTLLDFEVNDLKTGLIRILQVYYLIIHQCSCKHIINSNHLKNNTAALMECHSYTSQ